MGIEPTQSAWKAEILPLNYTRSYQCDPNIISAYFSFVKGFLTFFEKIFQKYMQQTISRVLSWMVIYLEYASPHISSHLLRRCRANLASLSGVAPSGVYSTPLSPRWWVSSYLAFSPLPADAGGIFLLHFP